MSNGAEEFFAGHGHSLELYRRVSTMVHAIGPAEERVTRSQLAFRRRRGFAYLWLPGRWLRKPRAELVLSIALPRAMPSPRWKEVAHPAPGTWMHHLELFTPEDLDAEVAGWLSAAYDAAG
jgi:hypothetical protein